LIHTGNDFLCFLVDSLLFKGLFLLFSHLFPNFLFIGSIVASSQENIKTKKYYGQYNVPKETVVNFWTNFLLWYSLLLCLSQCIRVFSVFDVNVSADEKERNKE